jgi:predicted kinase
MKEVNFGAMGAVLFYTVGLPGAGKTTFAASLSCWLDVPHLRGDKIGLELFRFPTFSIQERQIVYAEMNRRAEESLRAGKHTLYDATVNTRAQRDQLAALARQYGGKAVGIWVEVPIQLAKTRAGKLRDGGIGPVARIIPPHIFDQYLAAFEAPENDEEIAIVAGDASFALQYRRLQRQMRDASWPALI